MSRFIDFAVTLLFGLIVLLAISGISAGVTVLFTWLLTLDAVYSYLLFGLSFVFLSMFTIAYDSPSAK